LRLVAKFPTLTGSAVQFTTMAMNQTGRVLQAAGSVAEAEEILRRSLDIDPEQVEVAEHFVALRQRQCKWPSVLESERVSASRLLAVLPPLGLAYHTDDAMFQLARAFRYNKSPKRMPKASELLHGAGGSRDPRRKLRIGYVSSDLRTHAVGFAMTDVFETHDHAKFDIFAYYCGHACDDDTQRRIREAAHKWTDITPLDDTSAASRIFADGIDILVDLNGYSRGERTKVFALRPAPVAVNWFGFPSTMGSPYHHYIFADDYIIPPENEIYFSETVIRLPCYQPNDRRRVVSERCPTRREAGLPENAFVYCCMNGMQKLTPLTFGRWTDILIGVPDSVLWLLKGDGESHERLRRAVAARGVAPERLIFAENLANPLHLARYKLADLFLDTLPYGAHTTASDSLWMGVPVLTLSGQSFASRVCGSLLRAAGLPDMICATADDYVAKAIALGHDKARVDAMRQLLLTGRETSVLFDTPLLVRSLEARYRQIWEAFVRGERPVPDLRNLDLYHDIGVEADLGTSDRLDPEGTRQRYRQKLAERDMLAPLEPDARFWPPGSGGPAVRGDSAVERCP
jgi:predicted O-linked N-acetylglucosamine transferase (SPINDLY family)